MKLFDAQKMRPLTTPLLAWYDVCKREMAWRDNVSPYRTWVSEIMLQQTRVEAVRAYFDRWMKALPDIASLAAADSEEIHKLWEGLGYYSRVRNLQKAARIVCDDYGGFLPNDKKALLSLPGIGEYTAGAILSIAFGQRAAAVDGNVIRVFARYLNIDKVITDDKSKRALGDAIEEIMPEERCGDFTQALMELGALVCLPGSPRCEECPVRETCAGRLAGRAASLPVLPPKPEKKRQEMTICVLKNGEDVFLRKRQEKGLLAGLWEPWHCEGYVEAEKLAGRLAAEGIEVQKITPLGHRHHIFTHIRWEMEGYLAECDGAPRFERVTPEKLQTEYALPKAFSGFFQEKE